MNALYVNGLQLQMNEVAVIQFNLNAHNHIGAVVTVAMTYEVLENMQGAITECLTQYKAKVHQVQRDKSKSN